MGDLVWAALTVAGSGVAAAAVRLAMARWIG